MLALDKERASVWEMHGDVDEDLEVECDCDSEHADGKVVLVSRVDVDFFRRLDDEGEEREGDPALADVFVEVADAVRFMSSFGGHPGVGLFIRDLEAKIHDCGILTEQHRT